MFYRDIIKKLEIWAQRKSRKPLILRGARQVGKTTAVKMFAENFDQFIYLNLEKAEDGRTIAGKRYKLINLLHYMAGKLEAILTQIIK